MKFILWDLGDVVHHDTVAEIGGERATLRLERLVKPFFLFHVVLVVGKVTAFEKFRHLDIMDVERWCGRKKGKKEKGPHNQVEGL